MPSKSVQHPAKVDAADQEDRHLVVLEAANVELDVVPDSSGTDQAKNRRVAEVHLEPVDRESHHLGNRLRKEPVAKSLRPRRTGPADGIEQDEYRLAFF